MQNVQSMEGSMVKSENSVVMPFSKDFLINPIRNFVMGASWNCSSENGICNSAVYPKSVIWALEKNKIFQLASSSLLDMCFQSS